MAVNSKPSGLFNPINPPRMRPNASMHNAVIVTATNGARPDDRRSLMRVFKPMENITKNTDIAKKKSNVFEINTKIIKLNNVKKKDRGNVFFTFQGFLIDR